MSCPAWSRLVAERESSGVDPQGWDEALAHLDRCLRCAQDAPAIDPLLLFRRLPAAKVGPADVEAMRLGVAAMIRASRVEVSPRLAVPRVAAAPRRESRRRHWSLPAAVAALLVASLGLGAFQVSRLGRGVAPVADEVGAGVALASSSGAAEPADLDSTLEDLSLVDARVYEVASEGLSVVTIVHPSLSW